MIKKLPLLRKVTVDKILDDVTQQLQFVKNSNGLREINELFTKLMAKQKFHPLIKDENLDVICNRVVDLALTENGALSENKILAAAMIGRISAVARAREDSALKRVHELFTEPPLPIESLADGDEKYYASISIASLDAPWIFDYCSSQSVLVDTSEKARRILFEKSVKVSGALSAYWQHSIPSLNELRNIEDDEVRYTRIKRITSMLSDVIKTWDGDIGNDAGLALAEWFSVLIKTSRKDVEDSVIVHILDDVLLMLLRVIELRFSNAMLASTYAVLSKARNVFGLDKWVALIRSSSNLEKIRTCLKESALVLARQNKTDKHILSALESVYHSRSQVMSAIASHFNTALEIELNVKTWWEQAGNITESQRENEHKVGNTEDQQIGALLINVEESKFVIDKLGRAVVPMLEISEPAFAETVKKAIGNYSEISNAAKQLAAMRKLQRTDLKNQVIPYNPILHEMLGGHRLGVRNVTVVRDGINKDFGGKIKVLVKPRVTAFD